MGDSAFSCFAYGFGQVFSSFGRVSRAGGWVYWVIVGLCVLLLVGGLSLSSALSGVVEGYVLSWLGGVAMPEWVPEWVVGVAGFMSSFVVWVVVMLIVSVLGGSVILVVLSPLLSHVVDRVWVSLGNAEPHDTLWSTVRSILRGVLVSVKYLVCQLFCIVVVFIFGLIPVVGFLAPLFYLFVNAFFYGASFADYALERSGRTASAATSYSFSNRAVLVGMGMPFAVAMLVPFVGSYVALFLAPASAAAGACVVNGKPVVR